MKFIFRNKNPIIVTHDGRFHADDCFAVATILYYLNIRIDEVEIIRSRKPADWAKADYLVDVGGKHNEEKNMYDHHQEGGAGKRKNGIPYAAFGLVWKKLGEKICGSKEVAERIDALLVAPTDAYDNGMDIFDSKIDKITPYVFDRFALASNPTWQEKKNDIYDRFKEIVNFFKKIMEREVILHKSEYNAEQIVISLYDRSEDKRIIILDEEYPWKKTLSRFPEPRFVVYPRVDGTYGVKAVRDLEGEFKNRLDFPKEWGGKRNEELVKISGVSDALFCHNQLFMAVARTKEGALMLAERALNNG